MPGRMAQDLGPARPYDRHTSHPPGDPDRRSDVGSSLGDPERLNAVPDLGLAAYADTRLDRFADRLRTRLGTPATAVVVPAGDRLVFPGQSGLGDIRETPAGPFGATAVPLLVVDARTDPRTKDDAVTAELGVVGLAGHPVVDADGQVLGAVWAIDRVPHDWTDHELGEVREFADACSTELQLRLARRKAEAERAK